MSFVRLVLGDLKLFDILFERLPPYTVLHIMHKIVNCLQTKPSSNWHKRSKIYLGVISRNKFATVSTILDNVTFSPDSDGTPNKLLIPLCILYNVSTYSIWLFHILQGAQQFVLLQLRITETLKNLRGTDEVAPFFGRKTEKKYHFNTSSKISKTDLNAMELSYSMRVNETWCTKVVKKQSKKWPVRFQPLSLLMPYSTSSRTTVKICWFSSVSVILTGGTRGWYW